MVRPNSSPPSTQCFLICFPLISRRCNCKARSQAQRHQHLTCERTHSWFKNYAASINEINPKRHGFIMLFLAQKHNTELARGNAVYVHGFGKKRAQSKHDACNKAKGRQVMKRPTRKFWETRVSCLGSWLCRGVFDLWSTFLPLVWCSTGVRLLAHLSCQCIPSIMNRKNQCENSPNRQTSRKTKKLRENKKMCGKTKKTKKGEKT